VKQNNSIQTPYYFLKDNENCFCQKLQILISEFNQAEQLNACLPSAFSLVSCSAYFPTLKMEAICSSETSVDFQWTTRRYIPEDSTPPQLNGLSSNCKKPTAKLWVVADFSSLGAEKKVEQATCNFSNFAGKQLKTFILWAPQWAGTKGRYQLAVLIFGKDAVAECTLTSL
jgi:hypothetical protein